MTDDDVIKMARESGLAYDDGEDFDTWEISIGVDEIKHFAALVAKHEREACAKLVEPSDEHRQEASWAYLGGEEGVTMLDGLAADIRARGDA